jgi:putative NADH-flavin reductase
MKFAIYGAAGMVGSRLVNEALSRSHEVTALVRTPGKLKIENPAFKELQADASDAADVAQKVAGHDAVICAISPRNERGPDLMPEAAKALISGMKKAAVKRLLWVGGAGSLEVAPGVMLMSTPEFPKEYLSEAQAGYEALKVLREEKELDWSYLSPAAILAPGERKGKFRLGGDQLLVDANGNSKISMEDYAYALIYQAEKGGKIRQRFTVAY